MEDGMGELTIKVGKGSGWMLTGVVERHCIVNFPEGHGTP